MFRAPLLRFAAPLVLAAAVTGTSHADDWDFSMSPGPRWDDSQTDAYFKLRGRVMIDLADIDWSSPFSAAPSDNSEFRTARLGIEGRFDNVKYVAEFDFAGDNVSAKDVNLTISEDGAFIRLGQFKTMNSLEEQTSGRHTSFMERGMFTDLFGLDRRVGAAFGWNNDNFTVSAGIFGAPLDNNFRFAEANDSSAIAARVTWSTTTANDTIYHLGASFREMDYDGGVRLRARPNAHLSNRFAAADYRTGRPLGEADSSRFWGFEAAMVSGSFHAHGEYATMSLDGPTGGPEFSGGFVQAGYFLTGETRRYRASSGKFDRTSIRQPVENGGQGAWEVAIRYDFADMGDAGLGDFTTTTLGLNWYPSKYFRTSFNWVDGEHDGPGYTETGDALQLRMQFDF